MTANQSRRISFMCNIAVRNHGCRHRDLFLLHDVQFYSQLIHNVDVSVTGILSLTLFELKTATTNMNNISGAVRLLLDSKGLKRHGHSG